MQRLPFHKLSGAGNDFIVMDERDCEGLDAAWLARRLCTHARSVGADGLILVSRLAHDMIRVRFFNSDGSLAEMCGNGSRCAARFAVDRGFVASDRFRLATDSGDLDVAVQSGGRFDVAMPQPDCVHLHHFIVDVEGQPAHAHSLRVGVRHLVAVVPDVERIDEQYLTEVCRTLRHDPRFPRGTNVNVVSAVPGKPLRQRTYERGVEGLTLACGSGATASAYVAHEVFGEAWPVELTVDGGRLSVDQRDGQLWLIGDARLVMTGFIEPEAVDW